MSSSSSSARSSGTEAGELVTLSIGAAANNITAHYFNKQWSEVEDALTSSDAHTSSPSSTSSSAVDWRVLFRSFTTSISSTPQHIPRLVATSLSSETGYYAGLGDVIDYSAFLASSSSSTPASQHWDGRVLISADEDDLRSLQQQSQRQRTRRNDRNTRLSSSSSADCWTDLLTIPTLHPKNVYTFPPLQQENDTFDYFTQGREFVRQGPAMEAIMDRVRWFVEECDHLQGMQLIADVTNAWGGVADEVVSELRDEYDKTPLLFLGIHSPFPHSRPKKEDSDVISLAQLNSLLCMSRITGEVDSYLPLFIPSTLASSPPHLVAHRMATTWHHLSLPYCQPHASFDLRRYLHSLTPSTHANIFGCSAAWQVTPSLLRDVVTGGEGEGVALHSMEFMHQFQPFHALSHHAFTSRQQRRKGDAAREEDGDDDEGDSPPLSHTHSTLSSHVILRAPPASLAALTADLQSFPSPPPELTAVEGSEGGLCDAYTCDGVGVWLQEQSEVMRGVRRDAGRSFERMQREGGMTDEDWLECRRVLRDKAESYLMKNGMY